MKALLSDSSSSSSASSSSVTPKSGTTTANLSSTPTRDDGAAEARDSYYFPGCRKDANCDCEMCLASISATLDLMPASVQKSSFTKLSPSSQLTAPRCAPVSFNQSFLSTPGSSVSKTVDSLPSTKSAALREGKEMGKKKKVRSESGSRRERRFLWWASCFVVIFMADLGLRWLVSAAIRPELSSDAVRQIGVESRRVSDLIWKIRFLQGELRGLVEGRVLNCSDQNSAWKISQGGLLLNSRCTLYKSMAEEVSIWGWPLQTAGLLTAGASSRSFTVIKGRVTEWSNGNVGYVIRKVTSSWVHGKWSASVVQLDPGTLILEYKRSSILDESGFLMKALEFLKYQMTVVIGRMNQWFWYLPAFEDHPGQIRAKVPT
ncbi:hypothetical protein BT93_L5764 [Corymbia citriodora subsp. variegata]|uniref:Uncharacterized protein n=1 Tax=Corymbia citriodora subsp. variegata TaxID=360336 RepID=A0A8T0CV39_CORYI|nr:hypothetical protein BT93_L5764 [Corymbia citriodora subsp. variegata]